MFENIKCVILFLVIPGLAMWKLAELIDSFMVWVV